MLRSMTSPELPRWQRWLPRAGLIASGFTTMCCLGVAAAVSLATSVGATFMTNDSTLRPLLALTLTATVLASALTFWRHRNAGPVALTALAAGWVYWGVFGASANHHDAMGDEHGTHDQAVTTIHHGLTRGRRGFVWLGLMLLVGAQVWDVTRIMGSRRRRDAASDAPARTQVEA